MRRTALTAGGAALAIALAGCGGDGGNTVAGDPQPLFGNTQELVQAAAAEASSAKTAKMAMTTSFGGKTINADGAIRFAGKDSEMAMTMKFMGKSIEMRLVDQVAYIKKPGATGGASPKPWVKMPLEKAGMMSQFGKRADPTQMFKRIKQAGSITKSEQTKLNGQPVSHYWIKLDFAKMAETSPMAKQLPPQMMRNLKGVTLPMQLWLNTDKLPVKTTMDLSAMMRKMVEAMKAQMPEGAGNGQVTDRMAQMFKDMKVAVTYRDWGKPVEISAPPADKVTKAEQPAGSGSMMVPGMPN